MEEHTMDFHKMAQPLLLTCILLFCIEGNTAQEKQQETSGITVLSPKSFWRYHVTWGTELCRLETGELTDIHPSTTSERYYEKKNGKKVYAYRLRKHGNKRMYPYPPEDWKNPEFNDSLWKKVRGPFISEPYGCRKGSYRSTPLLCYRGKFRVEDPSKVENLTLSVSYLGGAVIYVNGKELTRGHMPEGTTDFTTPAEDYPAEAYFDSKGLFWEWDEYKKNADAKNAFEKRIRKIEVKVPVSMLKKGVNVLAVELHRVPAPEKFFTTCKSKKYGNQQHVKAFCWWSRIGLKHISLTAEQGAALTPNAGQTGPPAGFHVWTQPIIDRVQVSDYPDPCEPLYPVTICGARNGSHSGQVVVMSDKPITGFKAEVSALKGPGTIPASAVLLRYPNPDGYIRRSANYFESLEEEPPSDIPIRTGSRGTPKYSAIQSVWLTVNIPEDAAAGNYTGTVTINSAGHEPVNVPVNCEVVDWDMPDSREFHTFMGLIQSPETLSMYYKVPMWSDRHWELLDRTFSLLGKLATKVIYITAQYKTHFGNEESMIRYIEQPDGTFKPDFTIAEKYFETAKKHLGNVPVVGLYIWRSPWVTGNYNGAGPRGDRKILLTVIDPETGELSSAEGPEWGTPDVVEHWAPVVEGMKRILRKHDMEQSLMLGVAGDYTPTDMALADLDQASGGLKWVFHSHVVRNSIGNQGSDPIGSRKWSKGGGKKYPCGYIAAGWGGHAYKFDPDMIDPKSYYLKSRGYGWKTKLIRVQTRAQPSGRLHLESNFTSLIKNKPKWEDSQAGQCGHGRTGADFWPILGTGSRKKILAGRYTETRWGQLGIRCCGTSILAPGKNGAVATYRSEMLRENIQEIEARVFLEKALLDPGQKEKLGQEFAKRVQNMLDDRVRASRRRAQSSEIIYLSHALYTAAAEAADRLEKKAEREGSDRR